MIRWVRALEEVGGLDRAWVWPVRLDSPEARRALPRAPAKPEDLADAAGLPDPDAAGRRLLRRRLLKALAAAALDAPVDAVRLQRASTGGLSVTAPAPAFVSVAARGDWALLAISPAPVGVDLEPPDAAPPLDLFSAEEQALLAALSPSDRAVRLLRLWVAKEAYAKASGRNLDEVLRRMVGSVGDGSVDLTGGQAHARAVLHETADFVAAAVLAAPGPP